MLQPSYTEESLKISFRNSLQKMRNYDDSEKITPELLETFEVWREVFLRNIRVYSIISQELFKTDLQDRYDEELDSIHSNITLLEKVIFEPLERINEWKNFLWKIDDHIQLVRVQINKINESVQIAKKTVDVYHIHLEEMNSNQTTRYNSLEDKQNDLLIKSEELKKSQKKALKKSKNVQKDFIAILGIFASILIAAFGGLSALTSIFNNINKVSTGKLLFIGSFLVLSIIMIIFILLNGISKLSNLNLKSCGCDSKVECQCSVARKHPTLYIISICLIITSLLGASDYVIDYPDLFNNLGDGLLFTLLSLFILALIVLSAFYFHDSKKDVSKC